MFVFFAAAPFSAQAQNTGPNPTALSVNEQKLLEALKGGQSVGGRVSIPDQRAASLIRPDGRSWQDFRSGTVKTVSAIAILGMLALLIVFFLVRGRIKVEHGFSGRTVTRFASLDRFVHWVTATCFIILALTGLNITFGKAIVAPLFGEGAFGALSAWGKLAHNYLAFPFMIGIALMFLFWVKHNIPNSGDIAWLKAGGGIFSKDKHPPARRFNAGQKGIFWIVIIGGFLMSLSGWHLLFPSEGPAEIMFHANLHAIVGALFMAVMLAHIYIGSLGMEGAFDAMGTGQVDVNWAKQHHSLWLAETGQGGGAGAHAVPAE
ncbi:MAG: formate dehydrogenase subunit gamma [Alphaproteobacteria bacterium]|nr:formate dehydrogenase subunit gamma [Alphaproteobacteria bacterium]